MVKLIGAQEAYLDRFKALATPQLVSLHTRTVSGEAVARVEQMRGLAVGSVHGGELGGVTGPQWFDAATARIDLMWAVERALTQAVAAQARAIEAEASADFWSTLALSVGLILVTCLIGFAVSRSIVVPLTALRHGMGRLVDGVYDVEIVNTDDPSEIGDMARAVRGFQQSLLVLDEMKAQRREDERRAEEERREAIAALVRAEEREAEAAVERVNEEVAQLKAIAGGVGEGARKVKRSTSEATTASEQARSNTDMVASATAQLQSTVGEITVQVHSSSEVARAATALVGETHQVVVGLAEKARAVGSVVELISEIAEQTNLLALNATIESARAGEAGKGFAVVADEVKSLAHQTTQSAGQIADQVSQMVEASTQMSRAMHDVVQTIDNIDNVSQAIAAAVEEQSAATSEIARNIEETSKTTSRTVEAIQTLDGEVVSSNLLMEQLDGRAQSLTMAIDALHGGLLKVTRDFTARAS